MEKESKKISNGVKPNILVSITTTNPDWKERIKEIDKLGLKEIALFVTCIDVKARKEFYKLLEETKLEKIPFVHLRDDVEEWEYEYLIKKYKTEVFNTHFNRVDDRFMEASKKYLNKIYLENHKETPDDKIYLLDDFAGICLDISHWENFGNLLKLNNYKKFSKLLKKYKIGCCHISAIMAKPIFDKEYGIWDYASHYMHNLSEMDYVKKYKKYLPKICALEIENSLEEQLEIKKYIEKLLDNF